MKTDFVWTVFILLSLLAAPSYAARNPSAVYCAALGYSYQTKETVEGTVGFCKFTGSVECNSWDFLWGKCGTDYSYCAGQGYGSKAGKGRECGIDSEFGECLVCILPDGSSQEVTRLMNLSYAEGVCGDGGCVLGEDYENCPQDCSAVSTTLKDPAPPPSGGLGGDGLNFLLFVLLLLGIVVAGFFWVKRTNKK